MNKIMAVIKKGLPTVGLGLFNAVRSAVSTPNYVDSTENAFVSSARAKSLNQLR